MALKHPITSCRHPCSLSRRRPNAIATYGSTSKNPSGGASPCDSSSPDPTRFAWPMATYATAACMIPKCGATRATPNGFHRRAETATGTLNPGICLPPSAGGESSVLPNPIGYNRVYVKMGNECAWQEWWRQLQAGHAFVTNAPLLLCRAGSEFPGHVFRSSGNDTQLRLDVELISLDAIRSLQLVANGRMIRNCPLKELPTHIQLHATVPGTGCFYCVPLRRPLKRFVSS